MGIFDGFLKQLATGDTIKDYKHASRLFVDNNYALSPKYDWLYHVYFDVNPSLCKIDVTRLTEVGMLVKSIDLPKFTFDTKTFNNYNRPEVIQTKVKYDTIQVQFHDDQSDVVRNFWFDYFNHYYRDMDTSYADSAGTVHPTYHAKYQYRLGERNILNQFGYSPRSDAGINGPQYIQAIRIYSLHQKKFSEYTLINPMIVGFGHGTHATNANGSLEHTMTIAYTTVLYASGYVTTSTVKGFADLHYDKSPSPLTAAGGGTNSILGPGGIVSALDTFVKNPAAGAFGLFRSYNKNKNVDLKGLAASELLTSGLDILNGKDPRDRFFVPTVGSLASRSRSGTPANPGVAGVVGGSVNSNGSSIGLGQVLGAAGGILALTGKPEIGAGVAIAGLVLNSKGQVTGGPLDKTVEITPANQSEIGQAVAVADVTNTLSGFSFGGALLKIAKEREAKAKAEQEKKNAQQAQAYRDYYTTGAGAQTVGPVFNTGSNVINNETSSYNALAQTPHSSTIVAGTQTEVAALNSKSFIDNGNRQPALSYAGNKVGLSTNPSNG